MDNASTLPTVCGQPAELGCYISGHEGQYATDRVADIGEMFGWTTSTFDDPRAWRVIAEWIDERRHPDDSIDAVADAWERHIDTSDAIVEWLNDRAEGCAFEWEDGELFLVAACRDCGYRFGSYDDDQCNCAGL